MLYCTKLWNTDSGFYSCVIIKLINSKTYSITAYSISYNINFYYNIITITVYQTFLNYVIVYKSLVIFDGTWFISVMFFSSKRFSFTFHYVTNLSVTNSPLLYCFEYLFSVVIYSTAPTILDNLQTGFFKLFFYYR